MATPASEPQLYPGKTRKRPTTRSKPYDRPTPPQKQTLGDAEAPTLASWSFMSIALAPVRFAFAPVVGIASWFTSKPAIQHQSPDALEQRPKEIIAAAPNLTVETVNKTMDTSTLGSSDGYATPRESVDEGAIETKAKPTAETAKALKKEPEAKAAEDSPAVPAEQTKESSGEEKAVPEKAVPDWAELPVAEPIALPKGRVPSPMEALAMLEDEPNFGSSPMEALVEEMEGEL